MDILLVDDHALFRDGLALVLEKIEDGTQVYQAENADSALNLISSQSDLDLILLDLHLPGTNGFELLEAIKAKVPEIPVAIISADENASMIQQALNLGANGFITKTSNSKVMLSAIQLILAGDVYVPKAILGNAAQAPVPQPRSVESTEHQSDTTRQESSNQAAMTIKLTNRQQAVLKLMANGMANKEIAKELGMSPSTVKVHVAGILRAFDVANRTQAVAFAQTNGLV